MKVENMVSSRGNKIANQFILKDDVGNVCFQSYDSIIVKCGQDSEGRQITQWDKSTWDYSTTTSKYRNIFLGENKKETQKKIESGEYILTDLN